MVRRKTCPICRTQLKGTCYGCHLELKHGFVFRRDVPCDWLNAVRRSGPVYIRGSGINAVIEAKTFARFTRPDRRPRRIAGLKSARKEFKQLVKKVCA
jgi:hypothetical protein